MKTLFFNMQAIKRSNQDDCDLCYTSLLEKWLTKTDPLPKLTDLIAALQSPSIERGELASKVEAMIKKS